MSGLRMSLTDYNAHQARVKGQANSVPTVKTLAAEAQSPTNTPLRDSASISLVLPWPPSANHFTTNTSNPRGRRRILTEEARAYRAEVAALCAGIVPLLGRLELKIIVHVPDRRRRDISNTVKQIEDSLQHAGCFPDDEAIDRLIVERAQLIKGGQCRVFVSELCL